MPLPKPFIEQIEKLAEKEPRVAGLIKSLENTDPSTSIRLNKAKWSAKNTTLAIGWRTPGKQVPWQKNGFYLSDRPKFTLDPAIHQGLYYVQDASSMFLGHILDTILADRQDPVVYLDACAAPGGKTTTAIDSLPAGSMVVANEWDYKRAEILKENVSKWGYPNCIVSRGDTCRITKLRETFDIISADVPCSGEGMMRKDEEAVKQWTPGLVSQCASRQHEIVDNLWPALKPGGLFIYSTCTFNRSENEEIIDYIINNLGGEPVEVDSTLYPEILPGIETPYPCYRFMPHRVEGEGLFIAVIRKNGDPKPAKQAPPRKERPGKTSTDKLPAWIPTELHMRTKGDEIYGIDSRWKKLTGKLIDSLDVIMPGTHLATVKGHDYIPAQGLALSTIYRRGSLPEVEIDTDTALSYLHRDSVILPEGTPRGFVLLTHSGQPLGWVKNLGNRANNLYPAPWRILMNLK